LFAGLLASSQYTSERSCDRPSRHRFFLVFLCLQANAEMVPRFQVATACFSCSSPNFKLIKITPCCGCRRFVFKIIYKTIRNSKFFCLSEATPCHHNVFTFTLFLPEGRAGVAWEPCNKMMLFFPPRKIKCLISPLDFLFESTLHLSFPSLSLSFRPASKVKEMWFLTSLDYFSSYRAIKSLQIGKGPHKIHPKVEKL
jgi:hypothetical protein